MLTYDVLFIVCITFYNIINTKINFINIFEIIMIHYFQVDVTLVDNNNFEAYFII